MTLLIKTIAIVAAGSVLATSAVAQSAREIRGPSPFVAINNEAVPKLIVDPPLHGPLAQGIFQAQYRGERAHCTGVRGGRPQRISTCRASAHNRRRPPLVVGGCE